MSKARLCAARNRKAVQRSTVPLTDTRSTRLVIFPTRAELTQTPSKHYIRRLPGEVLASVNRDHLPRHIPRSGKIKRRLGDIVWRHCAGKRYTMRLERKARLALGEVRRDRTRPHCVYSYSHRRKS